MPSVAVALSLPAVLVACTRSMAAVICRNTSERTLSSSWHLKSLEKRLERKRVAFLISCIAAESLRRERHDTQMHIGAEHH